MNRETLETLKELAGATLAMLLFVILAWLFLVATPPQFSAERDLCAEQMEGLAK